MNVRVLLGLSLFAACAHAGDEEPQAPAEASGPETEAQVIDTISGAELRQLQDAPVTLKQLAPKERISLDEAVDLPDDI